jgi:hypothetical protein
VTVPPVALNDAADDSHDDVDELYTSSVLFVVLYLIIPPAGTVGRWAVVPTGKLIASVRLEMSSDTAGVAVPIPTFWELLIDKAVVGVEPVLTIRPPVVSDSTT